MHSADIQDRDGAPLVLAAIINRLPWPRHVFADKGYAGPQLRKMLKKIGKWTLELIKRSDTAVPVLQRENAHFWNWLGSKPGAAGKATGRPVLGVTMDDGTPVLGNVELNGQALLLAVTSAVRGTALVTKLLGDLLGTPLTEIETIGQAMAARRETPREPEPAIAPEFATPLVQAMLDRQYRAVLEEPVSMLGGITPRAAARTKPGRDRFAVWLKHLENSSDRQFDPADPMATYDFTWMWKKLGVENLRR